jgi:antitoxin (DNA-binding transcriptional repressor) of toxin-antitoxin stability system
MQAQKVGIREFREKLTSLLGASHPVAITRHGETVGYYIPARPRPKDSDLVALRTAAAQLDALIASKGVSEEELVRDFKQSRRRGKVRR